MKTIAFTAKIFYKKVSEVLLKNKFLELLWQTGFFKTSALKIHHLDLRYSKQMDKNIVLNYVILTEKGPWCKNVYAIKLTFRYFKNLNVCITAFFRYRVVYKNQYVFSFYRESPYLILPKMSYLLYKSG